MENAHMKPRGIQAANDLTGIGHLRIREARVGKAIHENANNLQVVLAMKRCRGAWNAGMLCRDLSI